MRPERVLLGPSARVGDAKRDQGVPRRGGVVDAAQLAEPSPAPPTSGTTSSELQLSSQQGETSPDLGALHCGSLAWRAAPLSVRRPGQGWHRPRRLGIEGRLLAGRAPVRRRLLGRRWRPARGFNAVFCIAELGELQWRSEEGKDSGTLCYIGQASFRNEGRATPRDAGRDFPNSGQPRSASPKFGRIGAEAGRISDDSGRILTMSGHIRPNSNHFRPISASLGRASTMCWPTSTDFGLNSADFDRCCPEFG